MKYYKQICTYPHGDCLRTCVACVIDAENLEDVPNFMRDGESMFDEHLYTWIKENGYLFVSIKWGEPFLYNLRQDCIVIATGKKISDGIYHSVVCSLTFNEQNRHHELEVIHDPLGRCNFDAIDDFESIERVDFISKKI